MYPIVSRTGGWLDLVCCVSAYLWLLSSQALHLLACTPYHRSTVVTFCQRYVCTYSLYLINCGVCCYVDSSYLIVVPSHFVKKKLFISGWWMRQAGLHTVLANILHVWILTLISPPIRIVDSGSRQPYSAWTRSGWLPLSVHILHIRFVSTEMSVQSPRKKNTLTIKNNIYRINLSRSCTYR